MRVFISLSQLSVYFSSIAKKFILDFTDRAKTFGIEDTQAVWLIPVLGMANTFGRVGLGILSSIPRMNAILINNISLTLCGALTVFSGAGQTSVYQFFYASFFGLTIGTGNKKHFYIIVCQTVCTYSYIRNGLLIVRNVRECAEFINVISFIVCP